MGFIRNIDLVFFHFINTTLSNSIMDVVSPAITDLHKTTGFRFIFVPLIGLLMLWKWRWKGASIFIGALMAIGTADFVGNLIKHWIERPRPFESGIPDIQRSGAGGFSFPSNHATNMFAMATYLSCFLKSLGWRTLFFGIAVLIAFSRVYNGVHYPADVIGGGFLGALSGWSFAQLVSLIIEKISQRNSSAADEVVNE